MIAGANGPGSGQQMYFSTNGGTYLDAGAGPAARGHLLRSDGGLVGRRHQGLRRDPRRLRRVGCNVWVYRSGDGGATWTDLETDHAAATPRRELTASSTIATRSSSTSTSSATSPRKDNIYITWHDNNILKFSRSTDFGHTWSAALTMSRAPNQSGIGSDITSDKNGNVYYFWPRSTARRSWCAGRPTAAPTSPRR